MWLHLNDLTYQLKSLSFTFITVKDPSLFVIQAAVEHNWRDLSYARSLNSRNSFFPLPSSTPCLHLVVLHWHLPCFTSWFTNVAKHLFVKPNWNSEQNQPRGLRRASWVQMLARDVGIELHNGWRQAELNDWHKAQSKQMQRYGKICHSPEVCDSSFSLKGVFNSNYIWNCLCICLKWHSSMLVLMKQTLTKSWLSPGTKEFFTSGEGVVTQQQNQTTN